MTTEHDRRIAITALRAAVPYLRLFQGKTFVIKAGGRVVADLQRTAALTDVKGLDALHQAGALEGGMLPKVAAIKDALTGGVARVHVIYHKVRDSLLLEVFTNEGSGTLVVMDTGSLSPEEA